MKLLSKLDKYIIKKYLSTFVFTIAMITMIAIAIDFFEKVDKFLKDTVSTHDIIFDYYLNFIPWINGLLWPIFVLISVIFFTSRMASDSEIVAMLSAGISYRRIMRPFILSACLLSVLLWVGKNYLIPQCTKVKNEFTSEHLKRSSKKALDDNTHFYLNPDEKIYIRYFRKSDSTAQNFRLEKFDDDKLAYVLKARKLRFISEPNNWRLEDYEYRSINGMNEELVLTNGGKLDTTFTFTPGDFIRYANQMEMMTTTDLRAFIKQEQDRGIDTAKKYKTELYSRTADPFTIIIVTLIGLAIASRKVRGGMGLHLAAGVILGSAYVIISRFSMTFAINLDMPAALGAWIPNIVFGVIAFYLISKAQK